MLLLTLNPSHRSYNTFQSLVNTTSIDAPHQDAGAGFSSAASRATARRLRRTRQRLGGHRHDLLVAMRVVNGIELEMMQSEWENWLADETYRCEQVRGMLSRGGGDGEEAVVWDEAGVQKVLAGGAGRGGDHGGKRREALKKWHAEYCGSCEADRKALVERRGLSSSAFVM